MITQQELKSQLRYCRKTGLFFRKIAKIHKVKVGDIAGCKNTKGYIVISVNSKAYLAHRLAWLYVTGKFPEQVIDHINRIKHDNRWENLRDVSRNENALNVDVHRDSKSGVKGVSYKKGRNSCWQVRYKAKTLGYFKTIEEAKKFLESYINN